MDKRIYGRKINIDTQKTRELYNERAKKASQMGSIYTSVLLGDQNPEYADEWNKIEKDLILPLLNIKKDSTVIDLGCGIGRWAETVMPLCGNYTGVDFSDKMINIASERCGNYINSEKAFTVSSVQDFLKRKNVPKADVIIISYVFMYINDEDMNFCLRRIAECSKEHCVIYFLDTVALEQRLTLNEIYSEAMHTDYSALYRTTTEYSEYFNILKSDFGYNEIASGYMPKLNNEKHFSETDRHYVVLGR